MRHYRHSGLALGDDKAEKVKVTEKERIEKHDTKEVTSPFIGEFCEVNKPGDWVRRGGRQGETR